METFGQNHGIQLMLSSDSGARITTGEAGEDIDKIPTKLYLNKFLNIL